MQHAHSMRSSQRRTLISRIWTAILTASFTLVATAAWYLCRLRATPSTSRMRPAPISQASAPRVVLVTALPHCRAKHGQYFMTKALQSKTAFARALQWELWPAGWAELSAAASTSTFSAETSDTSSRWAGLLLQMLSSKVETAQASENTSVWYAWMDAELLAIRPMPLPFDLWDVQDIHVVLAATDEATGTAKMAEDVGAAIAVGSTGGGANSSSSQLPAVSLEFALVRASRWSVAFLEEWVGTMAESQASAAAALSTLLASGQWRAHVRIEPSARELVGGLREGTSRAQIGNEGGGAASGASPMLLSFSGCDLCSPEATTSEGTAVEEEAAASIGDGPTRTMKTGGLSRSTGFASPAACRRALMRQFTSFDDAGPLRFLGAEHPAAGSVHVRPTATSPGWLNRHRGGLGRCLPSLIVIGSQRASLGSVHWALRHGWHRGIHVNGGERELHFFSMDNRYRQGVLAYERRFYPNSTRRSGCAVAADDATAGGGTGGGGSVVAEVSSTYFDYPKAPSRLAAILPAARLVVLLREPVSRALSAFNFRWLTWLCGKLLWTRTDCWASVISEDAVRKAQAR